MHIWFNSTHFNKQSLLLWHNELHNNVNEVPLPSSITFSSVQKQKCKLQSKHIFKITTFYQVPDRSPNEGEIINYMFSGQYPETLWICCRCWSPHRTVHTTTHPHHHHLNSGIQSGPVSESELIEAWTGPEILQTNCVISVRWNWGNQDANW